MDKKTVILECTPHFTQNNWENSLRASDIDMASFDFRFASGNQAKESLEGSHAGFLISLHSLTQIPENMRLLYSGISDFNSQLADDNPHCQVTSSKGIASTGIADYCLMAGLVLTQQFLEMRKRSQKKNWSQQDLLSGALKPIGHKKVAILGLGNNGMQIAERYKSMGCWVGGYSRSKKESASLDAWFGEGELETLIKQADIVILALPSRDGTRQIINSTSLSWFKKDACLVNIGRGDLIDEIALYNCLKARQIAGAMVDVVTQEPLPRKSKLWKLDNLIITPHISGNINNYVAEIQLDFLKKLSQTVNQ